MGKSLPVYSLTHSEKKGSGLSGLVQFELFEDNRHKYRIFVTGLTSKANRVIEEYEGRAGAETLIREIKREGLEALPTPNF
jgi:hypothetical protein